MTSALENHVRYYKSLSKPGYAILVTGAWGTGKTFQVRKLIDDQSCYYVSLYGLQSPNDIQTEIIAQAYPNIEKGNNLARIFKEISKKFPELPLLGGITKWGNAGAALLNLMLKKGIPNDRVLIFDDLERSDIPGNDLLGTINQYVEQRGFRVIVIAHDGEATDKLSNGTEKIFGQIIKIEPDIKAAFDSFIDEIPKKASHDTLRQYENDILSTFRASSEQSLRILKHTIKDLARLLDCLSPEQKDNEKGMSVLIPYFVAFNTELRAGNIKEEDIKNKTDSILQYRAHNNNPREIKKPQICKFYEKHNNINSYSQILSDELLIDIYVKGHYDSLRIQNQLNRSPYFSKPEDLPAWKKLWNFDIFEDDEVEKSINDIQNQIDSRSTNKFGEILQIFSMKFTMSEIGAINESIEEIKDEAKIYIDKVIRNCSEIIALPSKYDLTDIKQRYENHGYWIQKTNPKLFDDIFDYLLDAINFAFLNNLPGITKKILSDMENKFHSFEYKLCDRNEKK